MALWKEQPAKNPSSPRAELPDEAEADASDGIASTAPQKSSPAPGASTRAGSGSASESHIAPELVVEGKIEGAGHVRIAGHFKGDVNVRGDLSIENGAEVEGSVRAERVIIAGELTGNIETAAHVELLESGALTGDVKSKSFTVAKGSKMRGQVEFGWEGSKGGVTDIGKRDAGNDAGQ